MSRVIITSLLLFGIFGVTSQAHAGFRIRSARVNGRSYLFLRDVAAFYGMDYRAGEDAAVLSSKYSRLIFEEKLRGATLNGVQVNLSEAVAKWRGELLVSQVDFRLVLEPILRSKTLKARPIKRIVIDPGHGGRDPGAQKGGVDEKDINLAVAKQLYGILKRCGYDVYLTRTGDQARSLQHRAQAAGRARADLFISLHINAVDARHVSGIETFLLTPEGTASTYSNSIKQEASPGNAFDEENTRLAFEVQRELLATTGADDRGTKHANFAVLRDVPCAAVLVEMGFVTNAAERTKLTDPSYQRRLAVGISRGVRRFHRAVAE